MGDVIRPSPISGEQVLHEVEKAAGRFFELYSQPNLTPVQFREALEADRFDPLKKFSAACRAELLNWRFID